MKMSQGSLILLGTACMLAVTGACGGREETSADLALLLAVVSSLRSRPLPRDWVVFGEVGLSGEIRPVASGQERLSEAAKHGFKLAIVPKGNAPKKSISGLKVIAVSRLSEALEACQ